MASPTEIQVTIVSAKDTKNVNWRHGPNRPYAVVWVDPREKRTTKVDEEGDTDPTWNETLVIPMPPGPVDDDAKLCIDVVHYGDEEDTKPLIGSARLGLKEVVEEGGLGERVSRKLKLKRPSGRPHGKLEIDAEVREPRRHAARSAYDAPPYGQAYPPPPAGYPYAAQRDSGYYPYSHAPPSDHAGAYGQPPEYYGQPPPYGYPPHEEEKKKSGFGGMGMGLAIGATAGVLGGLALAEGIDAIEDNIADEAAEKVEEDLGYNDE